MIPEHETFDGTWPFAPHYFDGNGFHMHYVDEGEGDPIIPLHGEPTWGYLYRNVIPRLRKHGRVVVPDHMGFGKSETPRDRAYTIREHVENFERLVEHLGLKNITIVGQDWGGPIGLGLAFRQPDRVKRICLMNTGMPGRAPEGAPSIVDYPWFRWVQTDESKLVLANLGATVLSVMKRIGFERAAHVDETWVRAYSAPFPTPADCIGALKFPESIASAETAALLGEMATNVGVIASKPAMYVHGEADRALPVEWATGLFRSIWPNGPVVTLPGVGHFLQEDAPETVCALIEQFIQMTD